jgi:hypothetical protein
LWTVLAARFWHEAAWIRANAELAFRSFYPLNFERDFALGTSATDRQADSGLWARRYAKSERWLATSGQSAHLKDLSASCQTTTLGQVTHQPVIGDTERAKEMIVPESPRKTFDHAVLKIEWGLISCDLDGMRHSYPELPGLQGDALTGADHPGCDPSYGLDGIVLRSAKLEVDIEG